MNKTQWKIVTWMVALIIGELLGFAHSLRSGTHYDVAWLLNFAGIIGIQIAIIVIVCKVRFQGGDDE